MASLLLDTHILLWLVNGNPRLGAEVIADTANPDNAVFISAASFWEIAIKHAQGRRDDFEMPVNLKEWITAVGFRELPVTFDHARQVANLPMFHRDPFDRMLVAQAQVENLTLVTADPSILPYNVALRYAS